MENDYLYPGEILAPITIGENYREYLLSDILSLHDLSIKYIDLLYARRNLKVISDVELGFVRSSGCYVVLVVLSDGRHIALAPHNYHHNLLGIEFEQSSRVLSAFKYVDVGIRYYINNGGSIFRPIWSFLVSDDGSKKVSIGPEIPSSFCLLEGDLIFEGGEGGIIDVSNSELKVDGYYF